MKSFIAPWAIRSDTVGIPRMRSLPFDFGIRFSSTGGGNHVPEHSRFQILYRLPSRCWSNIFKVCPLHPGAPLLRRTSRYDAQTSAFGISNDFRCIGYVIPFWVVSSAMNVIPIPSLQTHYRFFITTTNESAPVSRYVPETGSHVPWDGLARAPAAFTPDAAQSVSRWLLRLSGDGSTAPFWHHLRFRCIIGQFTFVQLPEPHVTVDLCLFPSRSPPHSLEWSSTGSFGQCSCKPWPEGPPPPTSEHG